MLVTMFVLLFLPCTRARNTSDRQLLTKTESLLFIKGDVVKTRKSITGALPQLKCIQNHCHGSIKRVLCTNMGTDGVDVNWKCEAETGGAEVTFDSLLVICEGYDYPDDPYIVSGSCQLEYSTKYTTSTDSGASFTVLFIILLFLFVRTSEGNTLFSVVCVGLCAFLVAWGQICGSRRRRRRYYDDGSPRLYRRRSSGWGGGRSYSSSSRKRSKAVGYARTARR